MKKFIAGLFAALGVILIGVAPAQASGIPATSVAVHAPVVAPVSNGVVKAAPPFGVQAPSVQGRGIAPNWLYTSCYTAMNGERWCWRYSCTFFETVALGCRDGWYRTSTTWYA